MRENVVIVGAGVSGLVAAALLAGRGLDVTVLERAATVGGKLRVVDGIDAGPTVFTMRWVFDEIFDALGRTLPFAVTPLSVLARHGFGDGATLDLFADRARSVDAIGRFAGSAAAAGYAAFCARAARAWGALEHSYVRAAKPSVWSVAAASGPALMASSPFDTLWDALGRHFADPRLRQLFARYATYSGASPFQAPATLMLIAHVEQQGVWGVEGGMHRIATSLADAARARGATVRCGAEVAEIVVAGGRAAGVVLAGGERIPAAAVLVGADMAALAGGLFGAAAARATPPPGPRSLSALTWAMHATASGFPLLRHTVLFGDDYASEFADVFAHNRLPRDPTVYVCAQDRGDDAIAPATERLLLLVNAPATGDTGSPDPEEIARCQDRMTARLARCGLMLTASRTTVTGPREWLRLFPATGGALYGPAQHGWQASFRRPAARSRIPGLYRMGGSAHPGPGVPMAALSGRFAAQATIADLASTSMSRAAATRGGTSMR